jgi:hypothetical protein
MELKRMFSMKKIIKTVICYIIALGIVTPSFAATYYVSSTKGNDRNQGTESAPWAYCPGMTGWGGSATLHAGDTVYFDSAGTWAGSASAQILSVAGGVTYIGDEWGSGTRATLQSNSNLSSGVVYIGDDDSTYETILKGFYVDLNGHSGEVVSINRPSIRAMTGATKRVENCIATNPGYTTEGENHGIRIGAPKYDISNVEIINNVVHSIPGDGIMSYSKYASTVGKISNVLVRGNTVYDVGNATGNQQLGIYVKNQVESEIIEFNTVYSTPGDGIRIMADPGSVNPTNITIRHNIIYNTSKRGINLQQRATATGPSKVAIYGNIVYGCSSYGIYPDLQLKGILTFRVYNNTVYNNGGAALRIDSSSATYSVLEVKNNILDGGISGSTGYITSQSNNLTSNFNFNNRSNLPTGFTGTYGVDLEPNKDGLSIVSGNAIDGGTDLGSSLAGAINISGKSIDVTRSSEGAGWDIGAYEKITATINMIPPDNLRVVSYY